MSKSGLTSNVDCNRIVSSVHVLKPTATVKTNKYKNTILLTCFNCDIIDSRLHHKLLKFIFLPVS